MKKWFTLIELLVVITIIWILAVWATQLFSSQFTKSRDLEVKDTAVILFEQAQKLKITNAKDLVNSLPLSVFTSLENATKNKRKWNWIFVIEEKWKIRVWYIPQKQKDKFVRWYEYNWQEFIEKDNFNWDMQDTLAKSSTKCSEITWFAWEKTTYVTWLCSWSPALYYVKWNNFAYWVNEEEQKKNADEICKTFIKNKAFEERQEVITDSTYDIKTDWSFCYKFDRNTWEIEQEASFDEAKSEYERIKLQESYSQEVKDLFKNSLTKEEEKVIIDINKDLKCDENYSSWCQNVFSYCWWRDLDSKWRIECYKKEASLYLKK